MTPTEILHQRLCNQLLVNSHFSQPQQVLTHMVAMQAQEFAHAKWAIALRMKKAVTDTDIETAFNKGLLLRTHIMRPTWHFVSPADIRWLLQLTAPRVHKINGTMTRKLNLTSKLLTKTTDVLARTLENNNFCTRTQLQQALKKQKIQVSGVALAYVVMHAELEQVVCSGPRAGKQFTYALLDERAPAVKKISDKEALQQFLQRYITSRGPVTLQDFSYWSGLTVTHAQQAAAELPSSFKNKEIDGQQFYYVPTEIKKPVTLNAHFLMPVYDEYGMSYKNRAILASENYSAEWVYGNMIVLNGRIEGTWKFAKKAGKAEVETALFSKLNKTNESQLKNAIKKFQLFTV